MDSKMTQALSVALLAYSTGVIVDHEKKEKEEKKKKKENTLPDLLTEMTCDDLMYYTECMAECNLAAINSWPGVDPVTDLRPDNAQLVTDAFVARGFYVKQYNHPDQLHALLFDDSLGYHFAPTEEANRSMRTWIGLE